MPRSFASLARDDKGATILEFGLFAPVLAILAMGVIDLSRGLSERFTIQQAVNRSLEMVQSRPAVVADDATDVSYEFVRTEAAAAAGVPVGQVVLSRWRECDGVEQTVYADECAERADGSAPDTARYLRIRIEKTFNGEYLIGATQMVATGSVRIQ